MVKEQVYIRKLSHADKAALQSIIDATGLPTAKSALLYALHACADDKNEIARLNRIIEYKQKKIERLQGVGESNE
jgi:endonuclease III